MDDPSYDSVTDTDLLRAARRDPDAFCEFYDRHVRRLHAWLVAETRDVHLATDLTAETFAQALRSLRRFRGERPDSGRAWLYAIASHLLTRFRDTARLEASARRRLGMPLQYEETGDVDRRVDGAASRRRLVSAVSELPISQRCALGLRVVRELPYAEVARRLGCSPAAARIRVSRALRALNKRLEGGAP